MRTVRCSGQWTDRCKNITFPQLRLQRVVMLNFSHFQSFWRNVRVGGVSQGRDLGKWASSNQNPEVVCEGVLTQRHL